ncbi:MAG: hypothetical protein WCD18_28500 [Thermosynechococcaceae cyanobacterium]
MILTSRDKPPVLGGWHQHPTERGGLAQTPILQRMYRNVKFSLNPNGTPEIGANRQSDQFSL